MNIQDIESLFLEDRVITDDEVKLKTESLANLDTHYALQDLLRVSAKAKAVQALALLGERKFEEAYSHFISIESIYEIRDTIKASKESLKTVVQSSKSNTIKY